jgi:hypothetical protein
MNVGLLPLFPRGVDFRARRFRLLKDRHLFDTEDIATVDTTKQYFVTIAGKKKSQAIFTGDFSLVKEANLFLVIGLQALVRDVAMTRAVWQTFFNKGSFTWNVIVPETVTVDEDRISAIAPGPDWFSSNSADAATSAGPRYDLRRTYLTGANKIVPGGRAIEFTVNWQESGGNGLTTTTSLSIVFAGGEYEPGQVVSGGGGGQ